MENILPFKIFEAFDAKLPYRVDHEHRRDVEKMIPVSALTVYKTTQDPIVYIYEFKYKDAWEFHFNLKSLDVGYASSPKFKRAEYHKIIATLVSLMIERLQKNPTDTYRVYGVDKKMSNLYIRVLKYIAEKEKIGPLIVEEVKNFKSPTGEVYSTVYEIRKDTRTLKVKDMSENYL